MADSKEASMFDTRLFFDDREDKKNFIFLNVDTNEGSGKTATRKLIVTNITRELSEGEDDSDRISIVDFSIFKKLYDTKKIIPVVKGMIPIKNTTL